MHVDLLDIGLFGFGGVAAASADIARILIRPAGHAVLAALSRNAFAIPDSDAHPDPAGLQAALDRACHALIDAANRKGGGDNITVLLIPCL